MSSDAIERALDGDGARVDLQVPLIEIGQVGLSIGRHPLRPELRAITIGPLLLCLPLTEEGARMVVKGLTGVELASAADLEDGS